MNDMYGTVPACTGPQCRGPQDVIAAREASGPESERSGRPGGSRFVSRIGIPSGFFRQMCGFR